MRIRNTILGILLSIIITAPTIAQVKYLNVRGMVEYQMRPAEGATVKLYEGDKVVETTTTTADGTFSFKLEMNKKYSIRISKGSLLGKRIDFDTEIPADAVIRFNPDFAVTLMDGCPGVDASVLDKPVDIIKYNDNKGDFDMDKEYYGKMVQSIQKLINDIDICWQEKYTELTEKADELFLNEQYDEAKKLYSEAQGIYPNDKYVQKQLSSIEKAKLKEKDEARRYDQIVDAANRALQSGDLELAKQKYQEALTLNPSQAQELNAKLAQVEAKKQDNAQAQKIEADYQALLTKASQAEAAKNYPLAQQYLEEAKSIKPNDAYIQRKISQLQPLILQQKAEEERKQQMAKAYEGAAAQAAAALQAGNLAQALAEYQKALSFDPSQPQAQQKIKEIEGLLAKQKQQEQAALRAELEKKYQAAITEASTHMAGNDFDAAVVAYQKALEFKPSDTYANNQIKLAQNRKVAIAEQEKAAIESAYAQAMTTGNSALKARDFDGAIAAYQKALGIKPQDATAQSRIAETEKLVSDTQKAAVETAFAQAIAEGDKAKLVKDYNAARAAYNKALGIKSNDASAKALLAEVDRLEDNDAKAAVDAAYAAAIAQAEGAKRANNFDVARAAYNKALGIKANDAAAQAGLSDIKRLEDNMAQAELEQAFAQAMAQGDEAKLAKDFTAAMVAYNKAISLMPNQPTAKARIAETQKLIDDENRKQADFIASQNKFNELISQADLQFKNQKYSEARTLYVQASGLLPENTYPANQIVKIDNLLKKQQIDADFNQILSQAASLVENEKFAEAIALLETAKPLKPESGIPVQRINEIKALQAKMATDKIEAQYQGLIADADALFKADKLDEAESKYRQALVVKSTATYPGQQINAISSRRGELKQQAVRQRYDALISEAETAFVAKNYELAKSKYTAAQAVIPEETLPGRRINEIAQLQIKLAADALQLKYNQAIQQADNAFDQQQFVQAKTLYSEALKIKSDEAYPQEKINVIEGILIKQQQEKLLAAELEKKYNQTIQLADNYLNEKNYILAKSSYSEALSLKPGESYPQTKLSEISEIEAEIKRQEAERKRIETSYASAIRQADQLFRDEQYTSARGKYEEALSLKSQEIHPKEQIAAIDKIVADLEQKRIQQEAIDKKYQAILVEANNLFKQNMFYDAKDKYLEASNVKPSEEMPRTMIRRIDQQLKLIAQNSSATPVVEKKAEPTDTKPAEAASGVAVKVKMADVKSMRSESEKAKYFKQLLDHYPNGITKEIYKESSRTVNRIIIIRDNKANELYEIVYNWGGKEYSMNGKVVSNQYFKTQVRPRTGETVTEKEIKD